MECRGSGQNQSFQAYSVCKNSTSDTHFRGDWPHEGMLKNENMDSQTIALMLHIVIVTVNHQSVIATCVDKLAINWLTLLFITVGNALRMKYMSMNLCI